MGAKGCHVTRDLSNSLCRGVSDTGVWTRRQSQVCLVGGHIGIGHGQVQAYRQAKFFSGKIQHCQLGEGTQVGNLSTQLVTGEEKIRNLSFFIRDDAIPSREWLVGAPVDAVCADGPIIRLIECDRWGSLLGRGHLRSSGNGRDRNLRPRAFQAVCVYCEDCIVADPAGHKTMVWVKRAVQAVICELPTGIAGPLQAEVVSARAGVFRPTEFDRCRSNKSGSVRLCFQPVRGLCLRVSYRLVLRGNRTLGGQ